MEIKKIICALDLSEHSKTVAQHAKMYAELCNACVIAVYAAPTLTQYTGFHVPPNTIDSFVGEIVSGAEETMAEFVTTFFHGVEVRSEIVVGYAAEEVVNLAKKENADLIIMGTHGRQGIDRMLFGSVAEKIIKSSPVPVLTIRPKDEEEEEN